MMMLRLKKPDESLSFVETFVKKGIEVLYMTDPIDEYAMQQLKELDEKKIVYIRKVRTKVEETEEKEKENEEVAKIVNKIFVQKDCDLNI